MLRPTLRRAAGPLSVLVLAAAAAELDDECYRYDGVARVLEVGVVPGGPTFSADEAAGEAPGEAPAEADSDALALVAAREAAGAVVGSPETTRFGDGRRFAVWDEYRGDADGFDVVGAFLDGDGAGAVVTLAGGPAHQAWPSVAWVNGEDDGALWIAWEEGPAGWGAPYRSVDRLWNNADDERGPLHSWRRVKLARMDTGGELIELECPMPGLAAVHSEGGRRPRTSRLGVFYERPRLFADAGTLYLAVRHMLEPQLALAKATRTHVESGFTVDVRAVVAGPAFTPAVRLAERQRDGAQGLRFARDAEGVTLLAEVGRADRRADQTSPRVVSARLPAVADFGAPARAVWSSALRRPSPTPAPARAARPRATRELNGRTHTLLFGDLHRHTDLSLCFPFYDGSLEDAYRYARGPGALDFVAITDHARDLGRGDVAGLPWRRAVAAVDANHRPGEFVAFYAFERSQNDTDHNVISTVPGVLRPHTPPLVEFWAEIDPATTITIPHATSHLTGKRFSGDVWRKRDDARRPLAEVYQSYRDVDSLEELRTRALAEGQRLGFIASSDHLATSSAYACAWVEGDERAALRRTPILAALRARRTFGATARIELSVVAGGAAWMGDVVTRDAAHDVVATLRGPTPLERVEFWTLAGLRGTLRAADFESDDHGRTVARWSWTPAEEGPDACIVVAHFEGGDRAWASPLFAEE